MDEPKDLQFPTLLLIYDKYPQYTYKSKVY